MTSPDGPWQRWKPWWLSAIAGALLGCIYRLVFDFKWANGGSFPLIMTIGFLALVPLCMGYVAVDNYLRKTPPESVEWQDWAFLPAVSVLITMAVSLIVKWEGYICLVFVVPIMFVLSTIGGLVARVARGRFKRQAPGTLSAVALPSRADHPGRSACSVGFEVRAVETDLLIHAPAELMWDNIKSVREIHPSELSQSWVTRIGFPKPVAATLSHEGVGGMREARISGGLVFTRNNQSLGTGVEPAVLHSRERRSIPKSTLDDHVTVGGAFFDVLDGEYRLEPRPEGTLLRLTSHERLSTHFNPYAGLWTDAVMRSIPGSEHASHAQAESKAGSF